MALVWGVASLLLIRVLKPIMDYVDKKIPSFVTWSFIILFIMDVALTVYFKIL